MKSFRLLAILTLFSVKALASADSLVQPQVRFSPTMIANLVSEEKQYIKFTYGQPLKKGRKIFGKLVPYDELWRIGANEATELTVSTAFSIGNNDFKEGSYTIFAIPKEKAWVFILNSKLGQWGTFDYDPAFDIARIETPVMKSSDIYEGLTIELVENTKNLISANFMWDDVYVMLPITLKKEAKIISSLPQQKKKCWLFKKRGLGE